MENLEIGCHNLMEDIVVQEVDALLASDGGCQCPICRSDVIALALNHLPPRYVTTNAGRVAVKLDSYASQNRADIISALSGALKLVRAYPRHDGTT